MRSPALTFAGFIVLFFGLFLQLAGLPFGFAFLGAGLVMIILSFFVKPAPQIAPEDPSMSFCWFCMKEIPKSSETCPYCRMRQYSSSRN